MRKEASMNKNGLDIGEIDENDPIAVAIMAAEEKKGSALTGDEVDAIVKSMLPFGDISDIVNGVK